MLQIQFRPALLKVALGVMWLALVVLILLQFRWSAELGQAHEQRLNLSLSSSADNFRTSFQSDLAIICRAVQNTTQSNPPVLPPSTLPYHLYAISPTLEILEHFDPATNRFLQATWPQDWTGLREELQTSTEDLATASPRRWFNRPWLASSSAPVVFRAVSSRNELDEATAALRPQGFLVVALDLPALTARYFPITNDRTFASSAIGSRISVWFQDNRIFDSGAEAQPDSSKPLQLDLLAVAPNSTAPRFNLRPAGELGAWQLRAEHRPGSLDEAVTSLRRRNLFAGLAVSFVLLAGIVFLWFNARRAEQLAKLQTAFVAGFSHELRTPITAVCMLAGNLRDGVTANPVQVRQYGELILEQGNRLRARIEDILGYAAGRNQSLLLQPVALPELVEKVLSEEAALLQGFQVDTRFDLDLPLASADPGALKSCLANLVSNAAKYARQAAWLGVEVTDGPNGTLSITVADRGPGIALTDQAQIFEPFYRGREARSGNIPGSGLGLHLVRTRIESMGGKITIQSVPGKGTALTILLRSATE